MGMARLKQAANVLDGAPMEEEPDAEVPSPRKTPLSGLKLQLPLPVQIKAAEGYKEGWLVAGDFEGSRLKVQLSDDVVVAPSMAAKLATGKRSEVNGLKVWMWSPSPGERYSLHRLRAAGVKLIPASSSSSGQLSPAPPDDLPEVEEVDVLDGLRVDEDDEQAEESEDGVKDEGVRACDCV